MIRSDLGFRGTVIVAGLLIDPALLGEVEARRRVLAVHRTGSTVRTTPHGYLVTVTVRLDAHEALGAPVVKLASVLTTFPLDVDEARSLEAPPGSLIVAMAGEIVVTDLANAPVVDPSTWLDCRAYRAVPIDAPGRFGKLRRARIAPPRDPLITLVPPDATPDGRAARAALTKAWTRASAPPGDTHVHDRAGAGASLALGAAAGFLGFFASALSVLGLGLSALSSAVFASSTRSETPALAPREEPSPGWLTRLCQALEERASKLLLSTRLGALIGKKHAQYFEEMMDAFARKDFDEALKRAIPLGGEGADDGFETLFGSLTMRDTLSITPRLGTATGRFGVGPLGYQSLRDLYRGAFQALDERGDIDRAAFVLAELLRESGEAVAYLERHGRFRLAAKLAEHRKLDPGLVVRLWFRAGEAVRAVHLARRDDAFASAVLAAESAAREGGSSEAAGIARGLRAVWMDTLADAGDLEGAANVALADRTLRPFAVAFWRRARLAGGTVAGRSLAQALVEGEREDPASHEDIAATAERLLRTSSRDGVAAEERAGFVHLLAHAEVRTASPAAQRAARLAARLMLAGPSGELSRGTLEALLGVGGDTLLAADLPPRIVRQAALPERASLDSLASPGLSFADVALLRGGRRLVAARAHGVFLLDRQGRTLARFDAPATSIVVSDAGTRALALFPTGDETWRITRIDLLGRRAAPWTELTLAAFCPSFDGDTWLVCDGRDLVLLDCLGDRPAPLGKLPLSSEPNGHGPETLWRERDTTRAVAVQSTFDPAWRRLGLRRTQIHGFVLRGVRDFEVGGRPSAAIDGRVEWLVTDPTAESWLSRLVDGGTRGDARQLVLPDGFSDAWLRTEPRYTLIGGQRGDDAMLVVVDGSELRTLLEVRAPGAKRIVASEVRDGEIAVADDRGRSGVFGLPVVR